MTCDLCTLIPRQKKSIGREVYDNMVKRASMVRDSSSDSRDK